jgi:hypothetical protein
VYVESASIDRKLAAQNVALVHIEGGSVRLIDIESKEVALTNVEPVLIDALNSILILKKV